jgi:hypothetical protein
MVKGDNVSTSNKMEDYENLAKFISKGEHIPEHLLPLLLDVYQSSVELQNEENGVLIPKEYEYIFLMLGPLDYENFFISLKGDSIKQYQSSLMEKLSTYNPEDSYV